jgi:hypothetical protein
MRPKSVQEAFISAEAKQHTKAASTNTQGF